MENITLEKIDIIRERTGVNYSEAKEALELCNGSVVDTLVYLEQQTKNNSKEKISEFLGTKDEFKQWLNDMIQKGNVTRIKVKKDSRVIVDIPVNAGIAAGIVSMIFPAILGIGVIAAIATKVTIEITKEDGTVEVVNTVIKNVVDDAKNKMNEFTKDIKGKFNDDENNTEGNKTYSYTVNFDEDPIPENKGEVKVEPVENSSTKNNESSLDDEK
ncbi:DUF4342 domain-containing protein [Hathewaya histolytica]|uniref:UBA/TS-N domain-containing protein n=1 Tax=Hathewaya histolytica TaxID=1498 RepID=A0A4U9RNY6_HATHI|nr:DUF4342 domain-containing protein [Hathewaya histolytica]VTQ90570.1 UBA/TS-N domain-containing protein [Hathewaya histolytica]